MKPIKLRGHKPRLVCCKIYASRGLKCPECAPPVKQAIKEQHHD